MEWKYVLTEGIQHQPIEYHVSVCNRDMQERDELKMVDWSFHDQPTAEHPAPCTWLAALRGPYVTTNRLF